MDDGLAEAAGHFAVRRYKRDAAVNAVTAAGEKFQALARFVFGFGFGENVAAASDDRIGGQNESVDVVWGCGLRFFLGEAFGERARQLVFFWDLVDIRREDFVRRDADLLEKLQPSGRS